MGPNILTIGKITLCKYPYQMFGVSSPNPRFHWQFNNCHKCVRNAVLESLVSKERLAISMSLFRKIKNPQIYSDKQKYRVHTYDKCSRFVDSEEIWSLKTDLPNNVINYYLLICRKTTGGQHYAKLL